MGFSESPFSKKGSFIDFEVYSVAAWKSVTLEKDEPVS